MTLEEKLKQTEKEFYEISNTLDTEDFKSNFRKGAEWAIQQLEPKWIDVDKQKPPFEKYVIVWCRIYGRYITRYSDTENGGQWRDWQGYFGGLPPTKWAEILLPEPPKED